MKKIFFIVISIFVKSQQLAILDSIDHKPISFCRISDNKNLYLTDSLGNYNFDKFPTEEVTISSAGYKTKKQFLSSNTIYLSPKINSIEQIKISNNNFFNEKVLGYDKGKSSIIVDQKREYAIEIKNNNNSICRLDQIFIPFKKSKNNKGFLLIDFYESAGEKIGQKINKNNYVFPVAFLGKNNLFPLKEKIYLEKQNSLYVTVIWVENTFKKSELFSNEIFLYTIPNKFDGKMFVRLSNYDAWDLKPYFENKQSIYNIIPAFKIISKCSK